jgi:hypothetical protein
MNGTVPGGLPGHFAFGTQSFPSGAGSRAWMDATRSANNAAWDYRYTYFNAGVNTGFGWATWNSPAGQYATLYMDDSDAGGYTPVLVYYQILQSNPASGADESAKDFNNLNNTATMNAYYADFKLLLQRVAAFNKPVIIHIEPDLFGYIQKDHVGGSNNAANATASVASSGHADVAGLPNTFQGYCRALRRMRDAYAPQARLAAHFSMWASGQDLMANAGLSQAQIDAEADKSIAFLNSCDGGAEGKFDLFFFEFSDRDASYKWSQGNSTYWWSDTATHIGGAPSTFSRHRYIINRVSDGVAKRSMGWQVPVGNTVYQTCNNASRHWRSPYAQAVLGAYTGPVGASRIKAYADAGAIGMLFGAGQDDQTHPWDHNGDGITNGPNVAGYGSTQGSSVATVSDDDGGYLRYNVGNYYSQGVLPLSGAPTASPSATPSPVHSPTPTPSPTPDCPRLLNGAEALSENGSWAGSNASRSIDTVQGAAITQGSASLKVQVGTGVAWWNEGVANLSGFSPNVLASYSAISFDLWADPGSPPWAGGATVRNIAVHANAASLGKWSQPITADAPLAPGLNRVTLPFNFALGTVQAADVISTLQFNLKVDAPSPGVFHLDNIVLHSGAACPASPTPTRTRTPTRTATGSPTASASPSFTPSRTPTRTASPTATVSFTATVTVSGTASLTVSATPSASPSATASASRSPTPTVSPSASATAALTATATPTLSPSASATAALTATATPTLSPSASATAALTATATPTLSPTASATAALTATATPTLSPTASATAALTATATPTLSPTASATAALTATATPTLSPSASATAALTATATPTLSPSASATAALTATATPTLSPTASATAALTATATPTLSPTASATPALTAAVTPSLTPSPWVWGGASGLLLEAQAYPNPQRAAAVASMGPRFALKLRGQPRQLRASIYSAAMTRLNGWEQALAPVTGESSWAQIQGPPLALPAGTYFARFESDGSVVHCRFMLLH